MHAGPLALATLAVSILVRMLVAAFAPEGPLVLGLDDTIERRWGGKIEARGKLLLLAEAAVRLGRDAPFIVPEEPWRNIRGMGNLLRHEYDRVDLAVIWQTVTDDLPTLKFRRQDKPTARSKAEETGP